MSDLKTQLLNEEPADVVLLHMRFVREPEGGIKCKVDFPPNTDLLAALNLMGQAMAGLLATGVEMSKGRGLTDDQVLGLMGLPVNQ